MTVFDCFLYAGLGAERQLLRWRLEELRDTVDVMVLLESDRTFQGSPKPLYGTELLNEWPSDAPRLQVVQVRHDPPVVRHPLDREAYQRDSIMHGLRQAEPEDVILISDVDEIPSAAGVRETVRFLQAGGIYDAVQFMQTLNHGFINMRCVTEPWWPGTHATLYKHLASGRYTPQALRVKWNCAELKPAGWHFSFLGGVEGYQTKISAWSHLEWDKPPFNTRENIERALREGKDWDTERNMQYEFVPIDASYPRWVYEHRHDPDVAQHIRQIAVPA